MNNLKILRLLGLIEGISYLVLLGITMPMTYMYDNGEPNRIVGLIHGVLFMAYVVWVILVGFEKKWSKSTLFWAFLASLVPFGTFVADVKIFREETNA